MTLQHTAAYHMNRARGAWSWTAAYLNHTFRTDKYPWSDDRADDDWDAADEADLRLECYRLDVVVRQLFGGAWRRHVVCRTVCAIRFLRIHGSHNHVCSETVQIDSTTALAIIHGTKSRASVATTRVFTVYNQSDATGHHVCSFPLPARNF